MAFRVLIGLILAACLSVGAQAQTAQPVVTGYLSTSGCPSAATTPCFIQFGASGGSGGGSVTQGTVPWVVSGQGTAGTAATGVVTVQGIASMTKLLVTPDSVALPANQSVNVAQVNGVNTLTGTGATGTGAQRVTVAGDTATIAGSAPGTAGTASANAITIQGIASMTPVVTSSSPASRTLVTLDVKTVTTGATAVTALTSGHKTAGGWIQNPPSATVNLCLNEIGTAVGATSSGDTTCIQPGQTYYLTASSGAVSVISSDSAHPFSGVGLQ